MFRASGSSTRRSTSSESGWDPNATARGVEADRGVTYRVCAQSGIQWDGLVEPLNVAWVQETPLKRPRAGQTEEFWVLTTDATLTAEKLREVAHA